ncbi:MAG: hypothetical protein QW587_10650 [Candidatus Bathyarchaeia archaeon]
MGTSRVITYRPDITVNDIIVEPHGAISESFIRKMRAFRRFCPEKKIVLVVRNDDIPRIPADICNEVVPIEYYDLLQAVLRRLR